MATVHANGHAGNGVPRPAVIPEPYHPELALLRVWLAGHGYHEGAIAAIGRYASEEGTLEGLVASGLLEPIDYEGAEFAFVEGSEPVPYDSHLWGNPTGEESMLRPMDDTWFPSNTIRLDVELELEPLEDPRWDDDRTEAPEVPPPLTDEERDALPDDGTPDESWTDPRAMAPRTLAEVVDHEVLGYRAWGTELGDFLAGQMERVAQLVRFTGAATAAEYLDRVEVLELEARAAEYDRGHADGCKGVFSVR